MTAATALERLRAATVGDAGIYALPKPEPVIDGVLDFDSLAAMYGPSGSGKSFVALDMVATVASGGVWQGITVEPCDVLYVTAEGAHGMGDRLSAWVSQVKTPPDLSRLHFLTVAVSLFDDEWASALVELVTELHVRFVVIDTLARSMAGADENSSQDMGIIVNAADAIREATGACVLFVHHTGWTDTGHARGSSALKAALDTELECKGENGSITLKNPKQRCRAEHTPWYLALEPRGPSMVVVNAAESSGGDLRGKARDALAALLDADDAAGLTASQWRVTAGANAANFYRTRSDLVRRGLVENIGTGRMSRYRVNDAGRAVLAADLV